MGADGTGCIFHATDSSPAARQTIRARGGNPGLSQTVEKPAQRRRPGKTWRVLTGCLLLAGCARQPVEDKDVDLGELRPPLVGAEAARKYVGDPGERSNATLAIGYVSQDEMGADGARVAVNAVNTELGGFAGRTGVLTVCTLKEGQSAQSCAQSLSKSDVVITGHTPTDPEGLYRELGGIAITGLDPRSVAEETSPHATHFVLGRYGVLRAAATWAELHTDGDVAILVDRTSGERALLSKALEALGDERDTRIIELVGDRSERGRQLKELAGRADTQVVLMSVSPENCILAAEALVQTDVTVITHGICSTREVHDTLGDWADNWIHVADGPDLARYDEDMEAGYYRSRFEKEHPEGDWTGWSGLAFSAVMNVARAVNSNHESDMTEALRELTGEGYASAVRLNCPKPGEPDSRCLRQARFYVYSGKRSWVATTLSPLLVIS